MEAMASVQRRGRMRFGERRSGSAEAIPLGSRGERLHQLSSSPAAALDSQRERKECVSQTGALAKSLDDCRGEQVRIERKRERRTGGEACERRDKEKGDKICPISEV